MLGGGQNKAAMELYVLKYNHKYTWLLFWMFCQGLHRLLDVW